MQVRKQTKGKYLNTKLFYDNIKFDSKLEANIYKEIKKLTEENDDIICFLQPEYLLLDKFIFINNKGKKTTIRAINYIADFDISFKGKLYTLDAKGMETPVFKLKQKLFMNKYGREIFIVKSVKAFKELANELFYK